MRISVLSLIVSLASPAALQLAAQPASPELQGKALEMLRQAMSQPQDAQAASAPAVSQPVGGTLQERALQRLREEINAAPAAPVAKPSKAKKPAKPGTTSGEPAISEQPAVSPTPGTSSAAPDQPSGPRTKQRRLMDLLEQYRADKLSPAEYHSQKAKILSEP